VKHKAMQCVHRLVETLVQTLKSYQLKGRWKDHCCKECTELRTQITRGYLKDCHKECEKDISGRLKFTSAISGGLVPLKSSKEDGEQNHRTEVKFSGRTPSQFGQRFLKRESYGQNSLRRTYEITWTIGSHRSVRRLRLSAFQHFERSGGVTTVG
jgi:hypothetical protein